MNEKRGLFDVIVKVSVLTHHLVWTVIGLAIIILVIIVLKAGPQKIFNRPEAVPQQQSVNIDETLKKLPAEKADCVKKSIGERRLDEVAKGALATDEEKLKAQECLK